MEEDRMKSHHNPDNYTQAAAEVQENHPQATAKGARPPDSPWIRQGAYPQPLPLRMKGRPSLILRQSLQDKENEDEQFARQLNEQDQTTKIQMILSPDHSVDILMTQAEEERLPMPHPRKSKRTKEASKDPNRASVSFVKPSKNSKK